MPVGLKRAYDKPARDDGYRVLVDRMWPRGLAKDKARIDAWLKPLAPSTELRKWFHHDAEKWAEFKKRYFAELKGQPEVDELLDRARRGRVTLVYAARDTERNNAVALKAYLDRRLGR